MRKKVIIIVVCLLTAAILTALITRGANQKYTEVSRSVNVCTASEFIPMGAKVQPDMIKSVPVPEMTVKKLKMVTDKSLLEGKALCSHALAGNPIYMNQISKEAAGTKAGFKKVGMPVTQPSSDQAVAGDRVDVYPVFSNENSQLVMAEEPLVENAYVVASYDQGGRVIAPVDDGIGAQSKNRVPTMVEVEIPADKANIVVGYAAKKQIYLVRW